ncbi:MAG: prepilin-type N-terminal cleavage/methylation domain-containing protein [Candidatus Shapirobacteria bacterium]|nr:prepilin-type N-terminal cleavage/methylation domain-containing protein [Candidatus Shapirobacteria bacterium]
MIKNNQRTNPPLSLRSRTSLEKGGFTLIELLVVISIIGILTMISVSSFRNAQIKSRDAQRKSDLDGLSKALMMYYSDKGIFPDDVDFGNTLTGLVDPSNIETVYMRKIPMELKSDWPEYIYEVSVSKKSFNLFADLENKEDNQCVKKGNGSGFWDRDGESYCYGVASPNTVIGTTLP